MIIHPIIYRTSSGGSGTYPEPDEYEIDFTETDSVTVVHNSGDRCHVIAIDSSDNKEFGCTVTHTNENQCVVEWIGNRTGKLVIR